jgi:hypothetical protein
MDDQPHAGLLETYEVAIAELEAWDDPRTATLLASLRRLRERVTGQIDSALEPNPLAR